MLPEWISVEGVFLGVFSYAFIESFYSFSKEKKEKQIIFSKEEIEESFKTTPLRIEYEKAQGELEDGKYTVEDFAFYVDTTLPFWKLVEETISIAINWK